MTLPIGLSGLSRHHIGGKGDDTTGFADNDKRERLVFISCS
ncbi:hypothetical protein [Raoultella planticola]|jgi:hypothetical protein|nr:hypothetical protein [Raoultella planticola]